MSMSRATKSKLLVWTIVAATGAACTRSGFYIALAPTNDAGPADTVGSDTSMGFADAGSVDDTVVIDVAVLDHDQADIATSDTAFDDGHTDIHVDDVNSVDAAIVDTRIDDTAVDDVAVDDANVADARIDDAAVDDARPLQALNNCFATSNSACVQWDETLVAPAATGYELWISESETDMLQRSGSARQWNELDDPNLAFVFSPYGPQWVNYSAITALAPATLYYVGVWAHVTARPAILVGTGSFTTLVDPTAASIIFDETAIGWSLGFEPVLSAHARSGARALWIVGAVGWLNAMIGQQNVDISGLDDAAWNNGFLELYIDVVNRDTGPPSPIYYIEITLGDELDHYFNYSYPMYAVSAPHEGWQQLQVPLHQFYDASGTVLHNSALATHIAFFRIGTEWPLNHDVYIDDVRLRY